MCVWSSGAIVKPMQRRLHFPLDRLGDVLYNVGLKYILTSLVLYFSRAQNDATGILVSRRERYTPWTREHRYLEVVVDARNNGAVSSPSNSVGHEAPGKRARARSCTTPIRIISRLAQTTHPQVRALRLRFVIPPLHIGQAFRLSHRDC